jgi:hypothetical protein
MNIAVVCLVGPLDRFGYQHLAPDVLDNLCAFATRVYLVSSTRNRAGFDPALARHPNLTGLSDERTWFELEPDGRERFSIAALERNAEIAHAACRRDGMDCAIHIHINQFVPARARERLRDRCRRMVERGQPFEWLYKRYQLADRLFHADTRLPWILNLRAEDVFRVRADALEHRRRPESHRIQHGRFRARNAEAIVDCPLEMTMQDLADKMNYIACYADLRPGANPRFDPAEYIAYYTRKFALKRMSDEAPDPETGAAVAARAGEDFVSRQILSRCQECRRGGGLWARLWLLAAGRRGG